MCGIVVLVSVVVLCGCDTLRFAPGEKQRHPAVQDSAGMPPLQPPHRRHLKSPLHSPLPAVLSAIHGAMEFGLALAGLIGGVYGARAARFIKQPREKAKAIKDAVEEKEN